VKYIDDLKPDPASLIESMRDIGYSMETSVADLIDNSITAEAVNIEIRFSWNDGDPWLAIIDDGCGMASDELTNAMRLGSKNPLEERDKEDLGRYGLGLKTASFSQCRKLTVVSKTGEFIEGREWDLDEIAESKKREWKLGVLDDDDINSVALTGKIRDHGTLVLWQKLDRLDNDDRPEISERKLDNLIDCTSRHLELVYHRFLAGERGTNKIRISINGHQLNAFDPFNPSHPATQHLPKETVVVNGSEILIRPFILPHHSKLSKSDYKRHEGESGYLRNQGFYVYRNKRLIIHGTWFRLARQEELTKLARVQIDIPNTLDYLWSIDVKKSRATPPEVIRGKLRSIIERIRNAGSNVYKRKGQILTNTTNEPLWIRKAVDGKVKYEISRTHPIVKSLEESVSDDSRQLLRDLIGAIESRFPTESFFNDVAGKPENLGQSEIDKGSMERLALTYIENLKAAGMPTHEISRQVLEADPFSREPETIENILRSEGLLNE